MGGTEIAASITTVDAGYAGPEIPCDVEQRLVNDMLGIMTRGDRPNTDEGNVTMLFSVEHPELASELGITPDDAQDLIDGLYTRAFETAVRRGLIARPEGMTLPPMARLFCPPPSAVTGTGFAGARVEANPPRITLLVDGRRVPAYVGAVPPGSMVPLTHMPIPDYDYAGHAVYVPLSDMPRVLHSESHGIEMAPSASADRARIEMNGLLDQAVRTAVGEDGTVAGPRPRIEYDIVDGCLRNVRVTEFNITRDGNPIDPAVAREIERALEGREVPREAYGWEGHHVH